MKRTRKDFIIFGLPALMLLTLGLILAGCGHVSRDDFVSFDASDSESLSAALDEIKTMKAAAGSAYIINVTADIKSGGFLITGDEYNGKHITIKSNEAETRTIQYTKTVRFLFEVASGELTLGKGIVLAGINDNDKALCRAIGDGILVLRDNVVIKNNKNLTSGDPDGEAYRGGGSIEVRDGGKLIMYGGEITGNDARRGNGVGVFGRIKKASFVMEGGRIHHNNGTLSAGWGGGVHVNFIDDTFTMNGGTIDFNKTLRNGGGVSLCCGTFTINGSAVISDNEAGATGGGVSMCCCTVIMNGGVIKKNKAGTSNSTTQNSPDYFRYGGGIGRSGSVSEAKPFPGVWEAPNLFVKTGGIIYGDNGGENANVVSNPVKSPVDYQNTDASPKKGSAIFMLLEYKDDTVSGKYRFEDKVEYNPKNY
jgi:hypothetical protein